MLVDKIYYKYKYMGSWFAILRLKIENEYVTRVVRMPEHRVKELKVGDIL